MKKLLIAAFICLVFTGCTKEDPAPENNNANNGGNNNTGLANNTFRVSRMNNGGDQTVVIPNGVNSSAQGSGSSSYYSFVGQFSVGVNSTYDRLAVGFKSDPAVGNYTISTASGNYGNLGSTQAGVNITYDGYNYVAISDSGSVTVSIENGKKKVEINNVKLDPGVPLGTGGTQQIPEARLSGVMIQK